MDPVYDGTQAPRRDRAALLRPGGRANRLDPVEDRVGDLLLGGERDWCSPSASTITTSFSSLSNPISARETSLRTIASAPLRSSFSRARSSPAPVSAAKPTIVWPSCGGPPRPARMSSVGSRSSSSSRALAGDLARPMSRGPEVGRRRRHQQHVGGVELGRRARRRSSAAVSTSTRRTPGGAGSATLAATRVTSAPRRGRALGQRQAHPAAGAIADEANRVDRLAGAARRDQDPQSVPGTARARDRGARSRRAARAARGAGRRRARRGRRARPRRARSR